MSFGRQESFDGFLVRDIAVADLPLTSLIAQNQAFIAWCARSDRWGWGVFLNPLLARQLCGGLDDVAMSLLSLNLGGGLSVDSICHLRNRPALAFHWPHCFSPVHKLIRKYPPASRPTRKAFAHLGRQR
jgi:hypothetical protein